MKIISRRFLIVVIALLGVINVFSAPTPPAPQKVGPPVPPEDPVPIDENLVFLIMIAFLFGMYTIYRYKLKQKTPA